MNKFLKYNIKYEIDEKNQNLGSFDIGPLERGFGTTIGNSLRRVMLSNIPGCSVFAIKIPNITHEYATIDGIKEDVLQIILNLKKLVVKIDEKIFSEEEMKNLSIELWPVLTIETNKVGPITANDIVAPIGFEVINKDLVIAEKTKATSESFKIDIYTKTGRGFKSCKENQDMINSLSIIGIDSDFSPVLHVAYSITEQKISKTLIGDMLSMQIATKGSMTASDVLAYASKILQEHFEELANISETIKNKKIISEQSEHENMNKLSISIQDLDFSVRSYNCLKNSGILTIQELANKTKEEVENIENLGKKSLKEIKKKLIDYGLSFKGEYRTEENRE